MKLKLSFALLVLIFLSCSLNESPEIENINGHWRIYIGGEYSQLAKNIEIELSDTGILYDRILLDSMIFHEGNFRAVKHYKLDSAFRLDINLTIENRIWGYEIIEHSYHKDSTYIYGEKMRQP